MRIAHISDLHITNAPGSAGLTRADMVDRARALMTDLSGCPQLDLVVITGDTVNDARPEEYAILADLLAGLSVPVLIVPGNHDDRLLMRSCVPDRPYADPILLHHAWQRDHVRIFALDSLSPGEVAGRLSPAQIDWLRGGLARPFDGHTLVALHHPPCAVGMGRMDGQILIEGVADLRELLEAQPRPATILCGHLHRPFTARFGRTLVSAATSPAFQFALEPDAAEEPPTVREPFHYAIHQLDAGGGHVIHHRYPEL